MNEYYDKLETRTASEREQYLLDSMISQVTNAKNNSPTYSSILSDIDPTLINSLSDIAKIPITRKSDLIELQKQQRPFGGLETIKHTKVSYIFASPGPLYEPGSKRKDFARFARTLFAAGIRTGDVIHNCFSYHLTPAGLMVDSGAHALGCAVIPAGVGQTELQVQTISDIKPSAYVGTPSFLKIILEKADELNVDVSSIKKALVTGEALPPTTRNGFLKRGIQVNQCYSAADIGVIAYESESQEGLIVDEEIYLEIVRPGTGEPVEDGEVGEVVVTSFNPDYPLIRFATGDLSAIMVGAGDSPCGRTNRRIKGWMGRADQTTKVRGMFIHPEQVNKVVLRHPEITKARLVVEWINENDQITLKCEVIEASDELKDKIIISIREICKLRGDVVFLPLKELANDGLVIEDIRDYDSV